MKNWSRKLLFLVGYSLIGLIFYSLTLFEYRPLSFNDGWFTAFSGDPLKFIMTLSAFLFFSLLGYSALVAPIFFAYLFICVSRGISLKGELERIFGFAILLGSLSTYAFMVYGFLSGGLLGAFCVSVLKTFMGPFLIKFYSVGLVAISMLLIFRFRWMSPVRAVSTVANKRVVLAVFNLIQNLFSVLYQFVTSIFIWTKKCFTGQVVDELENDLFAFEYDVTGDEDSVAKDSFWDGYAKKSEQKATRVKKVKSESLESDEETFAEFDNAFEESNDSIEYGYALPDLDIFTAIKDSELDEAFDKELQIMAKVLEEKLDRFGVEGKVVSIEYGPVITLFQYEPSPDCKVSKIVALEDDLALALEATSIRIIAPIPGKSVVGFEISNKHRKDVLFSSVAHSEQFKNFDGSLPLVLGEDSIGHKVVVDLATMPHLLIAGSTGSGKSVALNAMLVSLLCKCSPDQLRLILIDPKRLEFSSYSDIAHLLFPIITQPRYAIGVLRWVVQEMESRYERMAEAGARNIFDYNNYCKINGNEELPFIVLVIDELADLMMTTGKDVEEQITRIAQMARASGIHMIVATQRPSVDVITGLIKVNFPSRVSFRVSSRVDSKTILDCSGSEKLLGKGDMLFMDSRSTRLQRVHGAYVSDDEINKVVSHVYSERAVEYLDLNELIVVAKKDSLDAEDEIYGDIKKFISEVDEVSISLLQRKFRIGYNRSARIIDQLESHGLILPADGSKLRKVIKRD
jgi:DNA segregation ATPase FtsK/SpoIIIE-like protein